jgi:transcription initiation factor TFIID subunit 7
MDSQQLGMSSQSSAPHPGQSPSYFPPYHSSDPTAGPSSVTPNHPTANDAVYGDTITAAARPTSIPTPRGRGRGRGQARARGTRTRGRGRSSTRLLTRAEQSSNVQKLKLSFKPGSGGPGDGGGGRKSSFLGEYDRELDENLDEPLVFEEQFILRVPREVAEGKEGLRERVWGTGWGLDGVEFKFLGGCFGWVLVLSWCFRMGALMDMGFRFETSGIQDQRDDLLEQACGFTLYRREPEDI